jgi:hypothetical protein
VPSWGSFKAAPINLSTIAKLRSEALRLTELADFDGQPRKRRGEHMHRAFCFFIYGREG